METVILAAGMGTRLGSLIPKPLTSLIDEKTKRLLHFSETVTRNSYNVHEGNLQGLRDQGCTDEEIFEAIAVAEKQHEKRYLGLASNIESGAVFKRDAAVTWRCRNCGYIVDGVEAPAACPACAHPQAHFELLGENW